MFLAVKSFLIVVVIFLSLTFCMNWMLSKICPNRYIGGVLEISITVLSLFLALAIFTKAYLVILPLIM